MHERPFVPAFTLHVFLGSFALESCTNILEDVRKGSPHLGQSKHSTSNNGTNCNGSYGLGEGDHLQCLTTFTCVGLNRDIGLHGCIINREVCKHSEWNEEEPSYERTEVNQECYSSLHEPTNSEHRRCQSDTNVGVGEGVPSSFFGPLRVLL